MSARDEFAERLANTLLPTVDGDEALARRVADRIAMMSWPPVRRDYEEVEVTAVGDAEARIRWSTTLVGTLTVAVESGEYRKPLAGGWKAIP